MDAASCSVLLSRRHVDNQEINRHVFARLVNGIIVAEDCRDSWISCLKYLQIENLLTSYQAGKSDGIINAGLQELVSITFSNIMWM